MIKIEDVVLDTAGNGVHRATVAITEYPSGAPAILYSDNGITQLSSNTVLTDEKGQYSFYIPNGRYTITVSKTGATTVVRPDAIQAYDGSGIDIAVGKSFTVLNTITLAGTDGTTITLPSSSTELAGITGPQTFTGLQTFATGITSAGPVTLDDTLTVAGPSSFTTIAATGAISGSTTLGITGLATLGSLTVTGATTVNSLTVNGAFTPTQLTTGAITSSALSFFNAGLEATTIETSGAATLASAIITGNASVGGTLGVTGLATFNNASVTQGLTIGDALTVTGATTAAGLSCTTLAASGAATFATTLGVTGATTLAGLSCTTLAASGNSTVGGTLGVTGATTLAALACTTLAASGDSTVGGTLGVTGATTLAGLSCTTLAGSGAATFATTLDVTGAVNLAKTAGDTTYVTIGKTDTQNGLRIYGRGSGSPPTIEANGFDTSINIRFSAKTAGSIEFRTRTGAALQAQISDTVSAVNYVNLTGAATTAHPTISALGSDTNIDLRAIGKGTGGLSTNKLKVTEGSNATMGVATLSGGTAMVGTTAVTANSRIFLTNQSAGGTVGFLRISARTAGSNFTISSSSGADSSVVAWLLVEPA